ncbi:MAG TPA: right-handed parallel beta-helix repeat-containing protein, partial [Longimicrobium sp.]|nr:right-handed parallel beta-helix repeat-containing protein [Longimicrobium sp.]
YNLELDGNIQNLGLGGDWGDVGRQLHATGIWAMENRSVVIRNVYSHDHGLDGVQIGYHGLTAQDADAPHLLEDVRSEYNGRQGLSWVGGIGLTALRCKFNFTGRRRFFSPPAAGVDAEAEGSVCRKGVFVDCEFLDNYGQGFVADTGDVEDVRLVRCRFAGTTNYSVWPNKPRIVFEDCDISGGVAHTYGSHDSTRATKFLRCHFEDRAYLAGKPVYGVAVIEANGNNVLYEGCTIIANASRALWIDEPGTREIIRDTVVIHRATSAGGTALQPNEFQSLVRGSVLDGVEFREENLPSTAGPFYIDNAGAEIRGPIWVQGPRVHWGNASGPVGVIGGAAAVPYRLQRERALYYGAAAPVEGAFSAGDVIFNRAAVAGGTAGWICVQGGSPGIWKAFGPIST